MRLSPNHRSTLCPTPKHLGPQEIYVRFKDEGLSLLAKGNTTILPLLCPVIYLYLETLFQARPMAILCDLGNMSMRKFFVFFYTIPPILGIVF